MHPRITARARKTSFLGEGEGQREYQAAGGHEGVAVEAVGGVPGFLICQGPGGPDAGVRIWFELALIGRDGQVVEVERMTDLEVDDFPLPVVRCECFVTDGLATLPLALARPGLRYMAEKTVRYPGHGERIMEHWRSRPPGIFV